MKKIIINLGIMLSIILGVSVVSACENKEELINNHKDYLLGIYPQYVLDSMTCEEIEYAINNNYVLLSTEEVTDYIEGTRASDTHATASKQVVLHHYGGTSNALTTLTATWFVIPTVRSYDLLAMRFSGPSYYSSSTNAYFLYSNATTSYKNNYDANSNNVTSASNGIGFAFKIPSDTTLNAMTFYMATMVNGSGTIAGTYQHAKQYVTKASAMNYTFGATGLGGVISHASSTTRSKYDGMGGVSVTV